MTAPLATLLDRFTPDHVPDMPGRFVVPAAMRAFVLAGTQQHAQAPILAVVPGEREAEDLIDDLALFTDDALLLPAWETLPFEHVSPNLVTMASRAVARHRFESGASPIIVGSVRAVTQRLSPSPVAPVALRRGEEADFESVVAALAAAGYHRTDRVETRGEFAVRGGIIDVFPAQSYEPARIEFWGDDIEDIRSFAVGTQRAADSMDAVAAYPPREVRIDADLIERAGKLAESDRWAGETWDRIGANVMFAGIESWLPWLADPVTLFDRAADIGAQVIVFDPDRAGARSTDLLNEEADLAAALSETWGTGAPQAGEHPDLYLEWDPPESALEAPAQMSGPADDGFEMRGLDAVPGNAESVAGGLNRLAELDIDAVVAMDGAAAAARVSRLLAEAGLGLEVFDSLDEPRTAIIPTGIHHGFVAPDMKLAVLGEQAIAGRRRSHRAGRRRRREADEEYRDLKPGDFVVHRTHGIGRFEGLVHREIAGVERDYLLVAYRGEDRLYVPTDQLAAVRRYTGGEIPRLSRMGGTDWATTRSNVRQAVALVAEQVVALYRERAAAEGIVFEKDTPWQVEFEGAFPFEETPDQLTAIADVKTDMESDGPMDRLIFGDVGFGKTEVAIRAAFKAVQSGHQVAILVPTTLLAQQHHATFQERLDPYPIRVEALSRFLTAREQKDVVAGLRNGDVDIVIGTHRLLSQDITFTKLGMVVIDEEQRFGVNAKDALRRLRSSVDVLTLTATPIPRTLEMALTGIRDVSHIRTPPEDRHPILTYVGPYDDRTISAAIRREMLREGQVFYVHNRVQTIELAVERLRHLVPDARYAIAHGQMSEGQLEQVMFDFWRGDYDVLVATTIIESGLDLPSVNTLIIERADRLGLAQLYQLRGRVGRSTQRAYAYLFHPPEQSLGEEAYRRLEAIGEFSSLGSGFDLAMRDLEIRGAGSILSEIQAGHIAAVGFDMYVELVADAVNELRGRPAPKAERPDVRIDLPVDAHLPDDYVPPGSQRIEAYRRLADALTVEEIDDVVKEWRDRFGELPAPAIALVEVARLRDEALRIGLREIVAVRNEIRMGPIGLATSQEVRLQRLAPQAVIRSKLLFIPKPKEPLLESLFSFLHRMWPPSTESDS
ncbi:MAG: transcription-repair coupling factor [bacterium]|nr:transcription-repair coupling factor [bacterium]